MLTDIGEQYLSIGEKFGPDSEEMRSLVKHF